jgi:hypothetical protein
MKHLLVVLSLAACAHGRVAESTEASPEKSTATDTATGGGGPTSQPPFTWEQIRDACPPGRRIDLRVEEDGKPVYHQVMTFVDPDDDGSGTDIRHEVFDDEGNPLGNPVRKSVKWTELRHHAEFPQADVISVGDETIDTPRGKVAAKKYVVNDPEGTITYYFDPSLPGPPVLYFLEKDGKRLMTATMIKSEMTADKQ